MVIVKACSVKHWFDLKIRTVDCLIFCWELRISNAHTCFSFNLLNVYSELGIVISWRHLVRKALRVAWFRVPTDRNGGAHCFGGLILNKVWERPKTQMKEASSFCFFNPAIPTRNTLLQIQNSVCLCCRYIYTCF